MNISDDYSNCACFIKDYVFEIKQNFPHIVKQFKQKLSEYKDDNMNFRRLMIRNMHYLKDLNDEIIDEIICHLEVKRYAEGSIILNN